MNEYLKNLNKIEFVVTNACLGRCRHCSQGDHAGRCEVIDAGVAVKAIREVAKEYDIKTVMAFGGEPLLFADTVCKIIKTAKELGIPKRQVITSGYFTKDAEKIPKTAVLLAECGTNDLLLSVDAFHQEHIPLETVKIFAKEAKKAGSPIRLQPAWLVSADNDNIYNRKTREILDSFKDMGIVEGVGNIIFPEGNALKYLGEYFVKNACENPYEEDPKDVKCLSFAQNGEVLGKSVYKQGIMDIIKGYGGQNEDY